MATKYTNNAFDPQCRSAHHVLEPAVVVLASLNSGTSGETWSSRRPGEARLSVTDTASPSGGGPGIGLESCVPGVNRGGGGGRSSDRAAHGFSPDLAALAQVSGAYGTSVRKLGLSSHPSEYHQDWHQPSYAPCHIGARVLAEPTFTLGTVTQHR